MLNYNRCREDDVKACTAIIGKDPETGQLIELNIHGMAAAIAVHSAVLAVSAAIKTGVEEGFLERMALALIPRLEADPHLLCPMVRLFSKLLMLATNNASIEFGDEGEVKIVWNKLDIDQAEAEACPLADLMEPRCYLL